MTLQECYETLGASYDDVLERMPRAAMAEKFLIKFLDDPNYVDLTQAMRTNDFDRAFVAVHTLKGVCLNLGLSNLWQKASDLTEKLRYRDPDPWPEYEALQQEYQKTIAVIRQFRREKRLNNRKRKTAVAQ